MAKQSKKTAGAKEPARKKKKKSPAKRWGTLFIKVAFTVGVLLTAWMMYLDAVVTRQFEGKKWDIPAKVYARPLELYKGKDLSPNQLQVQLKLQGYQAVRKVSRPGTFSRNGNDFVIYSRGFHFADGTENSRYARVSFQHHRIQSLVDKARNNLPVLRLDPQLIGGIYPSSYEDRLLIHISQAPEYLVPGLLAIEDRNFYEHHGVSLSSIARAMVVNLKSGSVVQGGSTLTQQLVKNFYLSNERTLLRKGKEAIMALLLEFHYDKEEILQTYLNEVYLGQEGRRAIHGFGLASQFYFAQPLQELSLAKTALLVAMVKGPSYYDPRRYPERALERRNLVLDVLEDRGLVSKTEVARSKELPLGIVSRQQLNANVFPAYLDLVKQQLRKDYDEKDLTSEGLRVFTNLDPFVQRQAQESIQKTLLSLDRQEGKKLQGAMVVTSAQTGDVLAVVGDRNSGFAGFNRALEAKRPVGSLLKPAVFLTALEQPDRYTLTSPVNDVAIKVKDGRGGYWEPHNNDRTSHGMVPLFIALAKSYNLATVNLGMELGVDNVLDTLKKLGIEENLPPYPSILLGSASLTPMDLAAMYQTIASGGFRMPLRAIDAVVDSRGKPLQRYTLSVERTIDADAMELLRHALGITMKEGTGRRVYQTIDPSVALGGKSGTSNDQRDSWFAGYSGNLMAVSWIGYDDNSPTHLYGSTGAMKAWTRLMSSVPLNPVRPLNSDSLEYEWVLAAQNQRTHSYCEGARKIPYIRDSEPSRYGGCDPQPGTSMMDRVKAWFQ
ncbi:penicillin-binding protein 1B [Endozoicomonas sp. Mp262]|uniref:penicillin-binding protein 1B n=1 Tax=Endozoicomonas sp. Mp262 TaxID=2919499 RepID=UPI0021DB5C2B